jgi:hypothetical protein
MTDPAGNPTKEQRDLLAALDPVQWKSVGYRLGPFHPWMANELVRLGLAERRPRARKTGAFEYRRVPQLLGENGDADRLRHRGA